LYSGDRLAVDQEDALTDKEYFEAITEIRNRIREGVIAALSHAGPEARSRAEAAIDELEAFGSIIDLFCALQHPERLEKERAVRVLKNFQDDVLLPLLALMEESEEVRTEIDRLFAPYVGDGLDPLIRALKVGTGVEEATINLFVQGMLHGTRESRIHAAQTLAQIGEVAVPSLVRILCEAPTEEKFLAGGTLMIIGQTAIEPLVTVLQEGGSEAKEIAARTLVQLGDDAVGPLIRGPWMHDADYRFFAVITLAQIGGPAIAPLIEEVRGDGPEIETFAGSVLLTMEDAAVPFLLPHLRDPNPVVRDFVGNVLIQMGEAAAAPLTQEFFDSRSSEEDQIFISMLLSEMGGCAVDPLIGILREGKREEKVIACYALSQVGLPATIPLKMLGEERRDLKEFVGYALQKIAEEKNREI
jgi:HEAT repeat protein